uniref:Uncharacterized protein n=1 Tax=Anguilla anguilla TaxID=7936 RepID=A0A0E9W2A6_ANGAN
MSVYRLQFVWHAFSLRNDEDSISSEHFKDLVSRVEQIRRRFLLQNLTSLIP